MRGFVQGSPVKSPPANARNTGSIPGMGRSLGERNGNPVQYCCLGNSMDRGAWQTIVHGVTKSRIQLSNETTIFTPHLQSVNYNTTDHRELLHSVQFSHSVVSDSLWPHEPQHARPSCPSPTPRVYPNPCPLSWWCHPTILSSVIPFSSCPQSFPTSGSFQMSQFITSGGQSTRVSAS